MRNLKIAHSFLQPVFSQTRHSSTSEGRKTLVILGTGWGGYSVLKNINKKLYDVIVVSPRNHFLFTPLLASTTVGTLEFRSVIEPVRNTQFRQSNHFHLSRAISLDFVNKILKCRSDLKPELEYDLNFDKLVIAVGARSNTFNVPGVEEHAFFLKEVTHARQIRQRIIRNFELAVQPNVRPDEKNHLLHTVIVGGGPTGVEFGSELYDFVKQDVANLYKHEELNVNVTLIESNKILSSFDKRLQAYAEKKIRQRERFNLLQSVVKEVKADSVVLKDDSVIPCGVQA